MWWVVTPSVQKSTAATTSTLTGSLSRSGCVITLQWLWSSLKRKTKPAFFLFYSDGVCFSCWYFSKSLISDHFCSTLGSRWRQREWISLIWLSQGHSSSRHPLKPNIFKQNSQWVIIQSYSGLRVKSPIVSVFCLDVVCVRFLERTSLGRLRTQHHWWVQRGDGPFQSFHQCCFSC